MEMKVDIPNLNKVLKALANSPRQIKSGINRAIRRSIYQIQRTAIPMTPVDTGTLRRSEAAGATFRDFYGEIFPNVEYAYYVHEGTKYMPGRPFLRTAMDNENSSVRQIFEEELGASLEEIAKNAK